jgi:hypothetical protein
LLSAIVLIAVFFVHLVLGFFLSKWLGSFTLGFGIIMILYAVQVTAVILCRERIKQRVMNMIIKAFNYYEAKVADTFSEKKDQ